MIARKSARQPLPKDDGPYICGKCDWAGDGQWGTVLAHIRSKHGGTRLPSRGGRTDGKSGST